MRACAFLERLKVKPSLRHNGPRTEASVSSGHVVDATGAVGVADVLVKERVVAGAPVPCKHVMTATFPGTPACSAQHLK